MKKLLFFTALGFALFSCAEESRMDKLKDKIEDTVEEIEDEAEDKKEKSLEKLDNFLEKD